MFLCVEIFNWCYLSSPPQILRRPGVDLELGGLMCNAVIFGVLMLHGYACTGAVTGNADT